eukprot:7693823-Pyramimonas_sp.AAC.1
MSCILIFSRANPPGDQPNLAASCGPCGCTSPVGAESELMRPRARESRPRPWLRRPPIARGAARFLQDVEGAGPA